MNLEYNCIILFENNISISWCRRFSHVNLMEKIAKQDPVLGL